MRRLKDWLQVFLKENKYGKSILILNLKKNLIDIIL
jgi:hypothetical protein